MPQTPQSPQQPLDPVDTPFQGGGTRTPWPLAPVTGTSDGADAVTGETYSGVGVRGIAGIGNGVSGEGGNGIGVIGTGVFAGVVGQGGPAGPGILALGSYGVVGGAGGGPPIQSVSGVFPADVASLVNANKGFAAILSGKVLVTDALTGSSATFTDKVNITGTTTINGHSVVNGDHTVSGNVGVGIDHTVGRNATVKGDHTVGGKVTANDVVLVGSDCAEEFDIANAAEIEPGTVVVFDGNGAVTQCMESYSKRVAGVISGAGKYRPGVILGRVSPSGEGKAAVALIGRVYCKVDASYSPIEVGDMLTTSPTAGFAMKASDPAMSFGAVIGKALAPVDDGRRLIPILVTLQ